MRTLCGTILAAVAAFQAVAGIDCADVSVADFPRLAGEAGDSARIMRAVEAAGKGGVVWFPRGDDAVLTDCYAHFVRGAAEIWYTTPHGKQGI